MSFINKQLSHHYCVHSWKYWIGVPSEVVILLEWCSFWSGVPSLVVFLLKWCSFWCDEETLSVTCSCPLMTLLTLWMEWERHQSLRKSSVQYITLHLCAIFDHFCFNGYILKSMVWSYRDHLISWWNYSTALSRIQPQGAHMKQDWAVSKNLVFQHSRIRLYVNPNKYMYDKTCIRTILETQYMYCVTLHVLCFKYCPITSPQCVPSFRLLDFVLRLNIP